jgi:hypothetical protein
LLGLAPRSFRAKSYSNKANVSRLERLPGRACTPRNSPLFHGARQERRLGQPYNSAMAFGFYATGFGLRRHSAERMLELIEHMIAADLVEKARPF